MAWSIAEVARMSGVTSRTLRHYDAIGLLPPAYVHASGHRYYETGQLLRLQQILLLRELGVGLGDIAVAAGSGPDTVTALRRHHTRLLAEAERLSRLAGTVARTITELEGDDPMAPPQINRPENLFEGFNPADYEDEARERWPDHFDRAQQVAQTMGPEQMEAEQKELTARMIRMAELMTAGKPPADPEVQAEVDQHYHWVARYWTPSAQAYRNLGRMYVDDERFRASYERVTAGLAGYQRDAMDVYAGERLS
ncbi:MAG TPA: MerR family transcriptional regulator [Streptosporangiaceae bacterium]|nr:MerR family transcriptional regulator [Streptosporangiaceae bacterium]